jgi:hypothetical protein
VSAPFCEQMFCYTCGHGLDCHRPPPDVEVFGVRSALYIRFPQGHCGHCPGRVCQDGDEGQRYRAAMGIEASR